MRSTHLDHLRSHFLHTDTHYRKPARDVSVCVSAEAWAGSRAAISDRLVGSCESHYFIIFPHHHLLKQSKRNESPSPSPLCGGRRPRPIFLRCIARWSDAPWCSGECFRRRGKIHVFCELTYCHLAPFLEQAEEPRRDLAEGHEEASPDGEHRLLHGAPSTFAPPGGCGANQKRLKIDIKYEKERQVKWQLEREKKMLFTDEKTYHQVYQGGPSNKSTGDFSVRKEGDYKYKESIRKVGDHQYNDKETIRKDVTGRFDVYNFEGVCLNKGTYRFKVTSIGGNGLGCGGMYGLSLDGTEEINEVWDMSSCDSSWENKESTFEVDIHPYCFTDF